jgi:UDP-2,3-diacylglucosamine pyrophosphatase LpxH
MQYHFRTLWLSDIHLGSKDCKAHYLLDFLNHCRIDTLYLAGDIIDLWAMSKQFRWPEAHNLLLHKLMAMSLQGTKVVYMPGNHDQPLQKYHGMDLGQIKVRRQIIHTTADGRKLLVLHGDQFDQQVCFGVLHSWIGDKAYDLLLFMNRWYNRTRTMMGLPYWSLAGYIKGMVNGANLAIQRYVEACCSKAKELNMDGIVCGHIHHPQIIEFDGITYYNDGDWIENCTALTENHHGEMALISWTSIRAHQQLNTLSQDHQHDNSKAA